jgi:hypothetical protein
VQIFKIALYLLTIGSVFFFAFLEMKFKDQLTGDAPQQYENVSDFGVLSDLSKRLGRERFLRTLPRDMLFRYRAAVTLKFLFVAILVAEVLVLQR